jgi:hypothetical protein
LKPAKDPTRGTISTARDLLPNTFRNNLLSFFKTPQAFQQLKPQLLQSPSGVGKPSDKYSGKIHDST